MTQSKTPQILIRRKYKHPINKVWKALTEKEAISVWLMETDDFELQKGAAFTLKTTPRGKFDGVLKCVVQDIDEPHTISYSWQSNGMAQPTQVLWTLKKLGENETLLVLSHGGFVGFDGWITKTMLSFGWKKILNKKLSKHLSI